MEYREKLLELIMANDPDAMNKWIAAHPELDQVDIYRELKELAQEILPSDHDENMKDAMQLFDQKIEAYQEKILDEKVAQLKYEMALKERDKQMEEIDRTVDGIRNYLKECVTTNAPNAKEMKELAHKIMASEKENGVYKADNWLWLEE